MTENCSYNSKAQKNKDAGALMYSFACKYYFLIARRFEPRPHLKASKQTQLKVFYYLLLFLNGVVVTVLNTCAGSPSSNP